MSYQKLHWRFHLIVCIFFQNDVNFFYVDTYGEKKNSKIQNDLFVREDVASSAGLS